MAVRPAERERTAGRGSDIRVPLPPIPPPGLAPGEIVATQAPDRYPWQRVPFLWFILPALLGYGVLFVYPTIRAFYLSFFEWSGVGAIGDFIGLRNFEELLLSDRFWSAALHSAQLFLFIFIFQNTISL